MKNPLFPHSLKQDHSEVVETPLVGYTVKTNTTDIQTVDSDYSKTIHQEMEEDHKTKETKELRNIRVKLN